MTDNVKSLIEISLQPLTLHLLQQKPGLELLLLGGLLALANVPACHDRPFYYLFAILALLAHFAPLCLLVGMRGHLHQLGVTSNLAPLLVQHVACLLDLLCTYF